MLVVVGRTTKKIYFCSLNSQKYLIMGKGDKRTKKGKRVAGSYGKSRPNPKLAKKAENEKKAAKKNA
jgi:ribosomal small subunit protein bTHX